MQNSLVNSPVLLFLDEKSSLDGSALRRWISESRFDSSEATNVFAALEELSDFTMPNVPDVFIVKNASDAELGFLREFGESTPGGAPPVISMSDDSRYHDFYACNALEVKACLEKLIPAKAALCN